jgi:phosphohistidine phosphatase SixA
VVADHLPQFSVEGLIDLLLGTPPEIRSVLFVGHNPTTISELVDALAGPTDDVSGFSPATRVTLEIPVPWSELSEGRAAIVERDVRGGRPPVTLRRGPNRAVGGHVDGEARGVTTAVPASS